MWVDGAVNVRHHARFCILANSNPRHAWLASLLPGAWCCLTGKPTSAGSRFVVRRCRAKLGTADTPTPVNMLAQAGPHACRSAFAVAGARRWHPGCVMSQLWHVAWKRRGRHTSCSRATFLTHIELLQAPRSILAENGTQTNMQELRADAAAPVDRKGAGAVALSGHLGEHQEPIQQQLACCRSSAMKRG